MATQYPVIEEYIAHPSFRPLATFFLGLVFLSCIQFSLHAPLAFLRRRRRHSGFEASRSQEKVNSWLNTNAPSSHVHRPHSINISLAMAAVAQLGSLLVFTSSQLGGCAFLVAWSGMAAQCARLLGLMKLSLDMKKLGLNRWELHAFWLAGFASIVIMFVNNSISIGILKFLPDNNDMLCFRDRSVGLAVAQSSLNIVLELYTLFRLLSLIAPSFLSSQHWLDAVMDIRAGRALSLFALDMATAIPAAQFFSVLADTIPGSLITLLVLGELSAVTQGAPYTHPFSAAFNHRSPNVTIPETASIPTYDRHSLRSERLAKTPSMINSSLVDIRSNRYSHPHHSLVHPFAAHSLRDPAPETEDWPTSAVASKLPIPEPAVLLNNPTTTGGYRYHRSASKSRRWPSSKRVSNVSTISQSDSELAMSLKGAVVGFAFKDTLGGGTKRTRERDSQSSFVPVLAKPVIRVPAKKAGAGSAIEDGSPDQGARPMSMLPQISVTLDTSSLHDRGVPTCLPLQKGNSASSSTSSSMTDVTGINSLKGTTGSDVSAMSFHLTPSTLVPRSRHESAVTAAGTTTNTEQGATRDWPYDAYSSRRNSQDTRSSNKSEDMVSLPAANDDLSIVYEASHEESDTPPLRRPTTFGERTFSKAGVMLRVAGDGEGYPFVEGRDVAVPEGVPEDVVQDSNGSSRSRQLGTI